MLKLIIEDDEGRRTVVPFVRDEITIGRQEGNTIRLTERNVSRRHARLLRSSGAVFVEDLGSFNGVRVNGEKVMGRTSIKEGDFVQIGDYGLSIREERVEQPPPVPPGLSTQVLERPVHDPALDFEEAETLSGTEVPRIMAEPAGRRPAPEVLPSRPREVVELDPEEAPRLVVLNTELAGREFSCTRSRVHLGRSRENDICIDHRSLSRTHARLALEPAGGWTISDLESSNGLSVNGQVSSRATLEHLDVVELGHVRLRFVGAGQSWKFIPGEEPKASRHSSNVGRSRAGRWVGLTLGAAALGVGAWLYVEQTGWIEEPKVPVLSAVIAGPESKERLDRAELAIRERRFEEARNLLQQEEETSTGAERHKILSEMLASQASAEAKKLLDEGQVLLEKQQDSEARSVLTRCTEADPGASRCHFLLGSTFTKLGDNDSGTKHYRIFVELAPDAPEVTTVMKFLKTYDSSTRATPTRRDSP